MAAKFGVFYGNTCKITFDHSPDASEIRAAGFNVGGAKIRRIDTVVSTQKSAPKFTAKHVFFKGEQCAIVNSFEELVALAEGMGVSVSLFTVKPA